MQSKIITSKLMKKYIVIIASFFLLESCSNKFNDAALNVAEMWKAKKCTAEDLTAANEQKTIQLTLEDLEGLNPDLPKKNITSLSALKFIESLSYEDYEDYRDIKVIVKSNSTTFEKSYTISQILVAQDLFHNVDKFGNSIINENLNDFNNYFDNTVFPDTIITKIKNAILASDSLYGKQTKTIITSFDFKEMPGTKDTVFITHFETSNAKGFSDYKIVLKPSNKKIIYFGINDK